MSAPPRDSGLNGSAGAARAAGATDTGAHPNPDAKLWHVTLTVGGEPMEATLVKAALERLSGEQPFLLSGRYGGDRAEVRYWEEAPECADAAELPGLLGRSTRELAAALGAAYQREVVHRDDLVVLRRR